ILSRTTPAAVAIALPRQVLFVGAGFDFFKRSHALPNFQQSRLPQVAYAFALRLLGDVDGVAIGHDDAVQFVADLHDLVDADPTLVAGALAHVAADGLAW